jgi:hypothetical protein
VEDAEVEDEKRADNGEEAEPEPGRLADEIGGQEGEDQPDRPCKQP